MNDDPGHRYYYRPGLDMLAAHILRRAWRDCTYTHDVEICELRINGATKREARAWWRENAQDWAATVGIEIEVPEV